VWPPTGHHGGAGPPNSSLPAEEERLTMRNPNWCRPGGRRGSDPDLFPVDRRVHGSHASRLRSVKASSRSAKTAAIRDSKASLERGQSPWAIQSYRHQKKHKPMKGHHRRRTELDGITETGPTAGRAHSVTRCFDTYSTGEGNRGFASATVSDCIPTPFDPRRGPSAGASSDPGNTNARAHPQTHRHARDLEGQAARPRRHHGTLDFLQVLCEARSPRRGISSTDTAAYDEARVEEHQTFEASTSPQTPNCPAAICCATWPHCAGANRRRRTVIPLRTRGVGKNPYMEQAL